MASVNRTPGLLEPLSAALVGAGFFFFTAALLGGGLWRALDGALWRLAQPRYGGPSALLLEGAPAPATAAERSRRLAADLGALNALSPSAIVLEDFLDEPSQAEAKSLLAGLRGSLAGLPSSQAGAALARLSLAAASLDADEALEAAIRACGNVVLPVELTWAADKVGEASLLAASRAAARGYEVSLKGGVRQRLPGGVVLRAPLEPFASAAAGLCVVEAEADASGPVRGVAELGGRWMNSAGLDAARRQLGAPVAAQRFRWKSRTLQSLELQGLRLPLDEQARFQVPGDVDGPPRGSLEAWKARGESLRGRLVFFKPWQGRGGQGRGWERQERLYAAIAARRLNLADESGGARLLRAAAAAVLIAAAALAPGWVFAAAWALGALWCGAQLLDGDQPVVFSAVLLLAALLSGAGLLTQRRRRRRESLDQLFAGVVPPRSRGRWQELVPAPFQGAGVEGAYVCVAGGAQDVEAGLDAWLEGWGAFVERQGGSFSAFIPEPAEGWAPALGGLKKALARRPAGLSLGELYFQAAERFGALTWTVSGGAKAQAHGLLSKAQPGQILLSESDYAKIRNGAKIQVTGGTLPEGLQDAGEKVLSLISIG